MVDLGPRLQRPLQAIRRGESLLLVRSRQSGKTTLLRELAQALRQEQFTVVLCSLQIAEDQTLTGLYRHIEATLRLHHPLPSVPKWTPAEPLSMSFCVWLGEAGRLLGRPLVLILDEYDAPPRKLVTSLLRSFRSALSLADAARPFVHSLSLCGKTHVRELRDELRQTGDESRGTGSLWNVAIPLAWGALSRSETDALLDQYSEESGVAVSAGVRTELYEQTRGQPWLLSRICYQLDEQLGHPRRETEAACAAGEGGRAGKQAGLSVATVRAAARQLLDDDFGHLLSLGDLLSSRREAQELLLRLLGGEDIALARESEAQSYLLDLGVLVPSESGRFLELHNPIYATYLGRWLSEQG